MDRGTQGNGKRPVIHANDRESSRSKGRALPNPGKQTIRPVSETLKIMGYYTLFGLFWIFFRTNSFPCLSRTSFYTNNSSCIRDYAVESTAKADALNEEHRQEHELTARPAPAHAWTALLNHPVVSHVADVLLGGSESEKGGSHGN